MKSTGIVRKVDELGRIVIPKGIRDTLGIDVKDPIEIFIDEEHIILSKYNPACTFCSSLDNIVYFQGKRICAECLEKLKTQF